MEKNPRYPLKHLSVRVPWHDNAWNGTVCTDAKSNSACLILKNCAEKRDDELEQSLSGRTIEDLDQSKRPPCLTESGQMMCDQEFYELKSHPYVKKSPDTHGHFLPTLLRFPARSACTTPYRWMLKKNTKEIVEAYGLDYDEAREPDLKWQTDPEKGWVQEYENQKALLDCFYEHVEPGTSLVFFYAKQVPFLESPGRVITGVGRVKKIVPSGQYDGSNKKLGSALWENMVVHSIDRGWEDGFLLPYHAAIEHAEANPEFDPAELAVLAPDDRWVEFSYAAEHVSNDSAIRVLFSVRRVLNVRGHSGSGSPLTQL